MITLLEAAKYVDNKHKRGIYKIIAQSTPIAEMMPWERIAGNAYSYDREETLPQVAYRGVNEAVANSSGSIASFTERVVILSTQVFADRFLEKTSSNKYDLRAVQWEMASKAVGLALTEGFFEGDAAANPRQFNGLRNRIVAGSNQEIIAGVNGAALTLDMLDQLGDTVVGDAGKTLFLNKTLRRKITNLGRNTAGGYSMIDVGDDAFGHQVLRYNGIPLRIVEREDNEATILDFDETQGSSNVTSSIYCVRFGREYLHGLVAGGSGPEVYLVTKETSETDVPPGSLGRVEWYVGLCNIHPRGAGRLKGITNA